MPINWDDRIDNFYLQEKKSKFNSFNSLLENMIYEMMDSAEVDNSLPEDKELLEALDAYATARSNILLQEAKKKKRPIQITGDKPFDLDAFLQALPKFTPSEEWGKADSAAREEIKIFVDNIRGKSIQEKFEYLMAIQQPDKADRLSSVRRILSSLILLESLQSLINAYSASSAGYVFEGFIAALMNGHQVTDPEQGTLPIEDVMVFDYQGNKTGRPLSLKLLAEKGETKGSFRSLVDALFQYHPQGIGYVVAFKTGATETEKGLDVVIKEFLFTKDNIVPVLNEAKRNISLFTPIPKLLENLLIQEYISDSRSDLGQLAASRILPKKTRNPKEPLQISVETITAQDIMEQHEQLNSDSYYKLLQTTVGYSHGSGDTMQEQKKGSTQWYINAPFFTSGESVAGVKIITHGHLDVRVDTIRETAGMYTKHLGNHITNLFNAVGHLVEDVQNYFIHPDRNAAMAAGKDALAGTVKVQTSLKAQVGDKEQ